MNSKSFFSLSHLVTTSSILPILIHSADCCGPSFLDVLRQMGKGYPGSTDRVGTLGWEIELNPPVLHSPFKRFRLEPKVLLGHHGGPTAASGLSFRFLTPSASVLFRPPLVGYRHIQPSPSNAPLWHISDFLLP